MKINRNVPHCFCMFLSMTVIYFLLRLSQVSLLDYIRVHDVTLHKMQYWQLFCGTGKSDYRPLAAKANQQMTDINVFNRVSQRWFSLICVAADVSLRYFLDGDLRCLLVERHFSRPQMDLFMQILYSMPPYFSSVCMI